MSFRLHYPNAPGHLLLHPSALCFASVVGHSCQAVSCLFICVCPYILKVCLVGLSRAVPAVGPALEGGDVATGIFPPGCVLLEDCRSSGGRSKSVTCLATIGPSTPYEGGLRRGMIMMALLDRGMLLTEAF